MASPTFPGVTVNQTSSPVTISAGNIPGQPVAAFAANYNAGPTVPTFIASWPQFQQLYAGFKSGSTSYLPFAVYQYFNNGGVGCYVLRVPNSDAVQASLTVADVSGELLAPPVAPVPTTVTSGGTVLAGTYKFEVTYVNANGETTPSPFGSVTTTGSTSTITVPSPPTLLNATGYYVYATLIGGSTYARQQALGSPTAIGTNYVITAPTTSTGAVPPVTNTTGQAAMTITSVNPGAWSNNIYITVTATSLSSTSNFNLTVYQGGASSANIVESWNGISLNPAAPRYAPGMVNSTTGGSAYIKLSGYPSAASYTAGVSDPYQITSPVSLGTVTGSAQPAIVASTAGADGTTPIDLYGALSGTTSTSTAWPQGSFAGVTSQILNLNLPDSGGVQGVTPTVNFTLLNNTASWAASVGTVWLVVDGLFNGGVASSSVVAASYTSMTSGVGGSSVVPSNISSIYGPWLSITDPSASTSAATKWVPPGGAVLGYWAQNDSQFNVAQTPAGISSTVKAVALEAYFTPTDLGNLEQAQINPIKLISGSGFCIFGGLTTLSGYPSRYINVNRALMKIAHDLQYLTQFAVFQNNTPVLWAQMSTSLTNYLTQEMQAGVLAGSTPATSFSVICDNTVNTASTIAAGQVNATVAVAVASPAEFVIINLTQMASGSTATISS